MAAAAAVVVVLRLRGQGAVARLLEGGGDALAEARVVLLGARGGVQVDDVREDVEGEDEGDDPLDVGGHVLAVAEGEDAEGDGEGDLDDDEGELDPEGDAEVAVLAVFCIF